MPVPLAVTDPAPGPVARVAGPGTEAVEGQHVSDNRFSKQRMCKLGVGVEGLVVVGVPPPDDPPFPRAGTNTFRNFALLSLNFFFIVPDGLRIDLRE
jgi:hypothetical protein